MLRKYITCVDKIVLDTKIGAKCGGTGVTFDWTVITQLKQEIEKYLIELNKSTALVAPQKIDNSESYAQKAANILILAGGLNLQNASAAVEQHTFGLDFNSGLESAPGQKDPQMIKDLFKILRNY
jgi:indole-3-glycerol phosphate synthase/phosphoribosylanthranilate isomerase